jgi:hypothetical protein
MKKTNQPFTASGDIERWFLSLAKFQELMIFDNKKIKLFSKL